MLADNAIRKAIELVTKTTQDNKVIFVKMDTPLQTLVESSVIGGNVESTVEAAFDYASLVNSEEEVRLPHNDQFEVLANELTKSFRGVVEHAIKVVYPKVETFVDGLNKRLDSVKPPREVEQCFSLNFVELPVYLESEFFTGHFARIESNKTYARGSVEINELNKHIDDFISGAMGFETGIGWLDNLLRERLFALYSREDLRRMLVDREPLVPFRLETHDMSLRPFDHLAVCFLFWHKLACVLETAGADVQQLNSVHFTINHFVSRLKRKVETFKFYEDAGYLIYVEGTSVDTDKPLSLSLREEDVQTVCLFKTNAEKLQNILPGQQPLSNVIYGALSNGAGLASITVSSAMDTLLDYISSWKNFRSNIVYQDTLARTEAIKQEVLLNFSDQNRIAVESLQGQVPNPIMDGHISPETTGKQITSYLSNLSTRNDKEVLELGIDVIAGIRYGETNAVEILQSLRNGNDLVIDQENIERVVLTLVTKFVSGMVTVSSK